MKNFKNLLIAGGIATVALTACSMVDEYDQELVDSLEAKETAVKDSISRVEQAKTEATCDSIFKDSRDGSVYDVIKVYDASVSEKAHCWFKENLAYDDDNSVCYEGEKSASKKCKKYGRLYQGSKLSGVCPEGTHVASQADWEHLEKVYNISKSGASILKSDGDDDWAEGEGAKATNTTDFTALAAGGYDDDQEYFSVGEMSYWWVINGDKIGSRTLNRDDDKLGAQSSVSEAKALYYSVRCVIGSEEQSSKTDEDAKPSEEPVTNATITGFAQKGPFVKGTSVILYELEDGASMIQTGKSVKGEIKGDDGKFTLENVNISSQYATMTVNGYYKNEISGDNSSAVFEMRAVTDLTKRSSINVNVITHLEYDRVFYLVTEKGARITTAKENVEEAIFSAFHIDAEDFAIAEDLDIGGASDADAALLAVSVMILGGNSEADATELMKSISLDLKKNGEWNNDTLKAKIADWLADTDADDHFKKIRGNVEGWKLSEKVGNFEKYLTNFWLTEYGMDPCSKDNEGKIVWTENKLSKNTKDSLVRFICKEEQWKKASDIEKDTENWTAGKDSDVRNGSVDARNVYVFEDEAWRKGNVLDSALKLKGCIAKRNKEIGKGADDVWYVCLDSSWKKTTELDAYFAKYTPDDKNKFFNSEVKYDSLTDKRDGQVYKTVTIGTQTWMAENLNYAPSEGNAQAGKYSFCYDNDEYNCRIAGRLYTWTAAMNIDADYVDDDYDVVDGESVQGICPDGWVLPSEDSFETLALELGLLQSDFIDIKKQLQSSFDGLWSAGIGSNESGMSMVSAGYYDGEKYADAGNTSIVWFTGNDVEHGESLYVTDVTDGDGLDYPVDFKKNGAASVRCLKK